MPALLHPTFARRLAHAPGFSTGDTTVESARGCVAGCGGRTANKANKANAKLVALVQTDTRRNSARSEAKNAAVQLERTILPDQTIPATERLPCASCRNLADAHASLNHLVTRLGGANLRTEGLRPTPSLRSPHPTPELFFDKRGAPPGHFDRDGGAAAHAKLSL